MGLKNLLFITKLMTYKEVLEITRESIYTYKENVKTLGRHIEATKDSKREITTNLLKLTRAFYEEYGLPIGISYFLEEIGPKCRGVLQDVYYDNIGNLHDLLKKSGVWKKHGGETLKRTELNGEKVLVSERYPNVIFRDNYAKADVALIPKLNALGNHSAELSAVLFLAGYGTQDTEGAKKLGIIDYIAVKLKPYEYVYGKCHLTHLFSSLFSLPEERISYNEDASMRKGKYYNPNYTSQLQIQSWMIGSYFQNVECVFSLKENEQKKNLPVLNTLGRKKSFIRGVADCRGNITNNQILFLGGEDFLSFVQDNMEDLGFETSEIKPYMRKTHKLIKFREDDKKIFCTADIQSPIGSKVYEKLRRGDSAEIGIIVDHIRKEKYERCGIPDFVVVELFRLPIADIFQVNRYSFHLKGGVEEITEFMEEIRPRNPVKMMEFMRGLKIEVTHPNILDEQRDLQRKLYNLNISPIELSKFSKGRKELTVEDVINNFS